MLGKVFENLLEENLRKGKGTYYTPREIVHYMCEESLINFLATETNLSPDDLKSKYFPAYNKLGDEKLEVRDVSVSEKIIESLKDIKVVDPACGSGAFLVGMLQQITQLRNELEARSKLLGRRDKASTEYEIKKQTIQNCIYGVDIDPGAIEIAKLRLWLSLVVDYDLEEIEPLPNLDYKLMQGNSLLEELVLGDTSIKLYDSEGIKKVMGSKRMKNLFDKENQIGLFDGDNDKVMKSLKSLQLKYFSTSDSESKKEIRNKIERIEHELIETSVKSSLEDLKNQKYNIRIMPGIGILPEDVKRLEKISSKESQIFAVLDELNKTGTKPFFLWHLYFSDVFEEKGGFDVVIGNPPYFQLQKNKKVSDELSKMNYQTYSKSSDIYCIFYEKGIQLLKEDGILSFISSDSWLKTKYGNVLRRYLLENTDPLILIDFENSQVFRTAIVESNILVLKKAKYKRMLRAVSHNVKQDSSLNLNDYFVKNRVILSELDDTGWTISSVESANLRKKIEQNSIPLRKMDFKIYIGILNGFNDAYVINSEIRDKLVKEDPNCSLIIKPMLRGRDVDDYTIDWKGLWLINAHNGIGSKLPRINVERDFPSIYNHLLKYKDKLEIRLNKGSHWTNLRNCAYFEEFEKPKIIWGELSDKPKFAYDDSGYYPEATLFTLTGENLKYLLAVMNSKMGKWYFEQIATSSGMGTSRWKKYKIEMFPLKDPSIFSVDNIVNLVDSILEITSKVDYRNDNAEMIKVNEIKRRIDDLIFDLYSLNGEEIKLIMKND